MVKCTKKLHPGLTVCLNFLGEYMSSGIYIYMPAKAGVASPFVWRITAQDISIIQLNIPLCVFNGLVWLRILYASTPEYFVRKKDQYMIHVSCIYSDVSEFLVSDRVVTLHPPCIVAGKILYYDWPTHLIVSFFMLLSVSIYIISSAILILVTMRPTLS